MENGEKAGKMKNQIEEDRWREWRKEWGEKGTEGKKKKRKKSNKIKGKGE